MRDHLIQETCSHASSEAPQSLYPSIVGLPWSRSIPGQNDSPGVILWKDTKTPQDAFHLH